MLNHGAMFASILTILAVAASCRPNNSNVVVIYTSVDEPLAQPILREFELRTGVRVQALYDVEAAKTTGLVSRLAAEASNPRADVFWSSEFAQTLRLKGDHLLAPYDSPSAADIPVTYRDRAGYWTGFATRARVILVNTKLVAESRFPNSIFDLLDPSWGDDEVAIANPLFGTTATHAAALRAVLGPARMESFFQELLKRKVRVVDGNSVVRDMVASGEVKAGLTDTDDANEAIEKGRPVAMVFPDQKESGDELGTLIIPNTIGLVSGAPHPVEGKRLIDFLLSREVEARLAQSGSLQMPVRDGVPVPDGVRRVAQPKGMKVDYTAVAEQFPPSTSWLRDNFLR